MRAKSLRGRLLAQACGLCVAASECRSERGNAGRGIRLSPAGRPLSTAGADYVFLVAAGFWLSNPLFINDIF